MKRKVKIITIIFMLLLSFNVIADSNQMLKDISLHKEPTKARFKVQRTNMKKSFKVKNDLDFNSETGQDFNKTQQFKVDTENFKSPKTIKGIYLTGWVAGLSSRFNRLLYLVNNTELNAMVIDVKNVEGEISYNSQLSLAKKFDANVNKIRDLKGILQKCKENNIYTIARIPVFKDKKLATDSKYALKFYDKNNDKNEIIASKIWLNPYSREVWRYNVDLAIEAAMLGFDEIQLDYIRFPAFVNLDRYNLAVAPADSKVEIINDFISYAKTRLGEYGIPLSIDVFGLTTSGSDLGIGQDFSSLAAKVDYISPMVYPSHYAPGAYGLAVPEKEPYFTIFKSMQDAKRELDGRSEKLRPWLQDFSLRYVYGVKEVRDQIKAAKALGLDSWLLWNPSSRYTWQAFRRNDLVAKKQQVSVVTDRGKGDQNVKVDTRKSNAEKDESKERVTDRT